MKTINILSRRHLLLMAGAFAAGCRPAGAATPEATGTDVDQLIAAYQARRPGGPHKVGLTRSSVGGFDVVVWTPTDAEGAAAAGPFDLDRGRLERRFGRAVAEALSRAPGHAVAAAPSGETVQAVAIFQPGASFGALDYRLFAEDLASHGVMIIGLHPISSPRGAENRFGEAASEFRTVLDNLPGVLPPSVSDARPPLPVILVGHSIGGAGAVLALDHPRANAAINIDGDYGGATRRQAPAKPVLYLVGANPEEPARAEERRAQVWAEVSGGRPDALAIRLPDMRHLDVTDGVFVSHVALEPAAESRRPDVHATLSDLVRQWMLRPDLAASWRPSGPLPVTPAYP